MLITFHVPNSFLQLDPNAVIQASVKKSDLYNKLHRDMTAMQLAVNNILDNELSKLDSGSKPPGVRQVSDVEPWLSCFTRIVRFQSLI